jgi:hypothetical protein
VNAQVPADVSRQRSKKSSSNKPSTTARDLLVSLQRSSSGRRFSLVSVLSKRWRNECPNSKKRKLVFSENKRRLWPRKKRGRNA